MPKPRVLVIDDEPALRQVLAAVLTGAGYTVDVAAGVKEGAAWLARGDIDVALCDLMMPDGNGIDLLRQTRSSGIETVFVMITAMASLDSAVAALRAGAFDYLVKPVRNEELLHRLAQIDAMQVLRETNQVLRKVLEEKSAPVFHFASPNMREADRMASKVAPTDSTVLITGESGTGKGVLARAIHSQSQRNCGPLVTVNCSAIPEQLMESEFFGHIKGAFTGAGRARKGLFLEADKGTLFLDEIGELPMLMQTKLLHAIEEKSVRAVGSEQTRRIDTRIIAATNRNLPEMVTAGSFREDLFFRLSMFQIAIPPLREREADIRGLIGFLLDSCGAAGLCVDADAEAYLLAYRWPGNVRELANVINRARILADNNCIGVADLPAALIDAANPALPQVSRTGQEESLRGQLRRMELQIINDAVAAARGDRRLAALQLGISLSSLYRKLGENDIQRTAA